MNERIRKLALETDAWCDQNWAGHEFYNIRWEEKFAKLIVGKCVDICKEQANIVSQKYGPASLNMSFMANDCAQAIKEHFKE